MILDWFSIGLSGVGVLIGGLITWFFSWRAAKQLLQETNNLRKLNGLTIRILDEAKLLPENVKPTKDEAGNYTGGLTYSLSATSTLRSSDSVTAKVIRGSKPSEESLEREQTDN
jgi:hypothetical protein